jgi:single-strand DNA-binding protein
VLWRKLAEHAERFLHKGSTIYLEGKLRTRNWTDQQGQERHVTEIIGDSLQLLDKKGGTTVSVPDGNS